MAFYDLTSRVAHSDAALLRAVLRGRRPPHVLAVTNCIPGLCPPDPAAAVNVIRTTFETDRIPADWLAHLEGFDEVWVYAEHNRRAFLRSGVPPEKLIAVDLKSIIEGMGRVVGLEPREGEFDTIPEVGINPRPIQQPIPIWIGGNSALSRRRPPLTCRAQSGYGHGRYAHSRPRYDPPSPSGRPGPSCTDGRCCPHLGR